MIFYYYITYSCYNKCEYCYMKDYLNTKKFNLNNFNTFINILEEYNYPQRKNILNITGGEPTLIKELNSIIDKLKKYFEVKLFTSNLKFYREDIKIIYSLHNNENHKNIQFYNLKDKDNIIYNVHRKNLIPFLKKFKKSKYIIYQENKLKGNKICLNEIFKIDPNFNLELECNFKYLFNIIKNPKKFINLKPKRIFCKQECDLEYFNYNKKVLV